VPIIASYYSYILANVNERRRRFILFYLIFFSFYLRDPDPIALSDCVMVGYFFFLIFSTTLFHSLSNNIIMDKRASRMNVCMTTTTTTTATTKKK
jgi:hypothetical protein